MSRAPLPVPGGQPGATVFGTMFLLDSLSRALLSSVIPLAAYRIFQSERDVSLLYFAVGGLGFFATFAIPLLVQRLRRRWVYTVGAVALCLSAVLVGTGALAGLAGGMFLRVFGSAALYTTLNLYIMDYIRKRELVRSEPLRLMFGAISWTVGPYLGVAVAERLSDAGAAALSFLCAAALIVYFWVLRVRENPAVAPATRPPPTLVYNLRRFWSQPRLRLAYAIAFVRAVWWSMFYIYAPVFMVKAGFEPSAGALVVSLGNVTMFASTAFGGLARRVGVRPVVVGGFLFGGAATLAVAALAELPLVAAGLLVAGAAAGTALDALGGIAFLRAVHPYERAEMTTVYSTFRQASELTGPLLFAAILTFLPLSAVFVAWGIAMLVMAWVAAYLPRGL